jgi:hypothetical protein
MTNYNNANLQALHNSLTSVHPEQDRSNFAPKLAGDVRILLPTGNTYLTLNTIDSDGLVWILSDIDGWWNLSEPEIPDIQRGFGDGSFDVSGRILARNLTLTGSVLVQSNDRETIATQSQSARSQILNAFNLIKRGTWLIVDEDEYKRACFVRLSGQPSISTVNSKGRIDFSIGLKAPDPIKYEWIDDPGVTAGTSAIFGFGDNLASIQNRTYETEYRTYSLQPPDDILGGVSGDYIDTPDQANLGAAAAWAVDTPYVADYSQVTYSGNTYVCIVTHTSSLFLPPSTYPGTLYWVLASAYSTKQRGYNGKSLNSSVVSVISSSPLPNVSSNVVTITTSAAHGFIAGDSISIYNLTASSGLVDYVIRSVPSPTTFTMNYVASDGNLTLGSSPTATLVETTTRYLGNVSSGGETSSDTVTITNHGDSDVYCIFRVVGPFFGAGQITRTNNKKETQTMVILAGSAANSNQLLGPNETNDAVQYLEIDTRTKEVHVGNYSEGTSTSSSRGFLEPFVDWIYLSPGDNKIYFNDAGAGSATLVPTLEIYWRSGWIG